MRMSRIRVPLRARAVHLFAVAAVVLASALGGCTDASNVTSLGRSGAPMRFAVTPRFHIFGSVSNLAPINLAHLTVLDAVTRDTIAATVTITLDPSSAQWQLPVDFTLPGNPAEGNIIVLVELLNLTNGVASIEWSGETPPITVTPGAPTPPPSPIDLVQGPPDNLTVASIKIAPVTGPLLEGESLQLHAVTVATGTPLVFWAPLDPTRATVSANGIVTMLLPGSARVIASAGMRADTITLQVRQKPASVSVVPALIFTSLGAQLSLTGRVLDIRGAEIVGESVVFTVDNPAILDQTGPASFRARAQGVTQIFAAAASRPSVRALVAASVFQVAASIQLNSTSITLRSVNATDNVVGTALDASGALIPGAVLQWRSENPAVADVAPDGTITARGAGTTGIIATLQSATARVNVVVDQTVTTLAVNPAAALIEGITATTPLGVIARDPGGTLIVAPVITWTSGAPAIATVGGTGVVTAIANGTATVTAASGAVTATSVITVRQRVASIVPTPATVSLQAISETARVTFDPRDPNGRSVPLTFTTFTWSTDAATVATVDQTGLITARANGTATITIRAATGASATIPVAVAQRINTITVTPATSTLRNPGDFVQLSARAADPQGNPIPVAPVVSWTTSNPAVATVDGTGKVTARTSGNATITAANGTVQGSASIVVQLEVASIVVTPGFLEFTTRDAAPFTAVARDAAGSIVEGVSFAWSSSNAIVLEMDGMSGTAYPRQNGSATVVASAPNGVTGTAQVAVNIVAVAGIGVQIIPGSTPFVSNCIPFGQNNQYGFQGFMYRNIPAFHMNIGDRIAFDLGGLNNVAVRRNIFFAVLNKNPAPPGGGGGDVPSQDVRALSWNQVVAESQTPSNPFGNTIVGDYELTYTAEAEFDFPGGGFAVGFQGSPPATFVDGGCEQVLAGTTSQDVSGLFYARFFGRPDRSLATLDVPGGNTGTSIGGIKIYSPAPGGMTIMAPSGLRSGSVPLPTKPQKHLPGLGDGSYGLPATSKKKLGGGN